jgi:hypothetical protein
MSLIIDTVQTFLPPKCKHTPSGWTSFNAICCDDKRQRGGIIIKGDTVSYHCFNCQFKASWQPGRLLSIKFKKFLRLLNVPDEQINKCSFDALRLKETEDTQEVKSLVPILHTKELPLNSVLLRENLDDPACHPILEYIYSRGLDINSYDWYWTPEEGFANRLIIPFYHQKRIVGYTARLIRDGKPKYISEQTPGYVFNLDNQHWNRKFAVLCEGPLDAISIDGMAMLGSELSAKQHLLISRLNKEIIVVPDRDHEGPKIVKQAIEYGWSVSFPDWGEDVKDVADAVKSYGRLYALYTICKAKETNGLKIELLSKKWFKNDN